MGLAFVDPFEASVTVGGAAITHAVEAAAATTAVVGLARQTGRFERWSDAKIDEVLDSLRSPEAREIERRARRVKHRAAWKAYQKAQGTR